LLHVQSRRFPFDAGISGQDDFPDASLSHPPNQVIDGQVGCPHPIKRRQTTPKDVVDPAVFARPLNGTDIRRFLYRADNTRVTPEISADGTQLRLREVVAPGARVNPLRQHLERVRQPEAPVGRLLQEVVGQPQGRLFANTGQLCKL